MTLPFIFRLCKPVLSANFRALNSYVVSLKIHMSRHSCESASIWSEGASQVRLLKVGRRERIHPAQSKPGMFLWAWGYLQNECGLSGVPWDPIPWLRMHMHLLRPDRCQVPSHASCWPDEPWSSWGNWILRKSSLPPTSLIPQPTVDR